MGRKKSYQLLKNRRHNIVLTEKAQFILNEIRSKRPSFNFSRYISERLIDDLENDRKNYLKEEIIRKQKQADLLHEQMIRLSEELKKIKEDELYEQTTERIN
jgi:hypothetical protein